MSEDKIEEIRKRHEDAASIGSIIHAPDLPSTWTLVGWKAHHDRAFLLAEVDRQRAEIERLRAENEALHEALRRGDGDRFVVERRTTGPDTPVAFIREGKP